jgi:hypothetical protein
MQGRHVAASGSDESWESTAVGAWCNVGGVIRVRYRQGTVGWKLARGRLASVLSGAPTAALKVPRYRHFQDCHTYTASKTLILP